MGLTWREPKWAVMFLHTTGGTNSAELQELCVTSKAVHTSLACKTRENFSCYDYKLY